MPIVIPAEAGIQRKNVTDHQPPATDHWPLLCYAVACAQDSGRRAGLDRTRRMAANEAVAVQAPVSLLAPIQKFLRLS
jgi:hypothetical protein